MKLRELIAEAKMTRVEALYTIYDAIPPKLRDDKDIKKYLSNLEANKDKSNSLMGIRSIIGSSISKEVEEAAEFILALK